ncbi:general stress protein [Pseudoxanthomonas gei]|uniref:General stress protein n=1 Tax=Pseudoxanthomonas gei TaxID=1383030 RepID=A0ABX0AH06_9GAMM|nr:pyridoxamine 5'-phosphate oxidase family protein [Pseudoxanthomonas gei]NDK40173.1 general stress protein [Pseudoxanthomonas gei]
MTDRAANIQHLASLIKDVEIAMLTTTQADGRLVSRPLGTQQVEFDGDLWFATAADSEKVAEIRANPQVNVSYASAGKNTYVSVSGKASIVADRAKIEALWSPPMKIFFPEGKDDPNLRLIRVRAESAEYWDGPGTVIGKALYLLVAAVSDDLGAMSDNETLQIR